jgi:hypothetical protein
LKYDKIQVFKASANFINYSFSQVSYFYKNPKVAIGYDFGKNNIKAEISYMFLTDRLFFEIDNQPYGGIVNDNMFAGLEVDFLSNYSMGPLIGYELNFVFVEVKTSLINLNDFKGESNLIIRPEIGATILGIFSLNYGYNWTVYKDENRLSGLHQVTFSYNFGLYNKF